MNLSKILNYDLLIAVTLISFFLFSLVINFSNRIEGDAAFHALISREISERQYIASTSDHILADEKNNFPVAYPQLFHLTGALIYTLIGENSFFILPSLYGIFSLIALFLILRSLNTHKLGTFLALLFIALNTNFIDYSSKYFMEIALVFTTLTALAYSVKFIESVDTKYLYLSSILYGLSIGIKQQGFLILPVFMAVVLYSFFKLKLWKETVISLLILSTFSLGPLLQLFYSTGSVLYAGDSLPKIIQIIEKPFRDLFKIKLVQGDEEWSILNEGRRDLEIERWRNVSNSLTAWMEEKNIKSLPWSALALSAFLILIVNILKNKKMSELLILIFILSFYCLFYYLARPRYALPLIILPSIIIYYIINYLRKKNKKFLAVISALLVVFPTISTTNTYSSVSERGNFGFYGKEIKDRENALFEIYKPIKNDPDKYFTVLSPIPYETAFYTNKSTAWANPYGSTKLFKVLLSKNDEEAVKVFRNYRVKYLIIFKDRFMRYSNWVGITPSDGFLSNIGHSKNFRLILENEAGRVYLLKS